MPNPFEIEWISLEVDTSCNIRCTMCPIGHDLVENKGRTTLETVEKVCHLAQGWTDKISLAVMGEPLLHPEAPEMIKTIKRHHLKALLWTNGLLVNERRARAVLEAGLDKIIFSFEIIDKALHERIRKGASYDKVRGNLDRFIALRDEINPDCEISVWNIVPDANASLDVPDHIAEQYHDVEIYVSRAMDWHGSVTVESTETVSVKPAACNQTLRYLSVSYQGDIIACCNDFNHEMKMINVHDIEDLKTFWHGPRKDLLEKQQSGNLHGIKPCETCSAPYERESVDRTFQKGTDRYQGKMASNAAKQVQGIVAQS